MRASMFKIDHNAGAMLRAYVDHSEDIAKKTTEFFKYVNSNDVQGPAIVSYYSQIRKIEKRKAERFPKDIANKAAIDFGLKREVVWFRRIVKEKYPKTFKSRIFLASHGAVVSDRVKPRNSMLKLYILMNKIIKKIKK